MYKAGLAHRAQNKGLRQATQEQRDNKEFKRGYKAIVTNVDMDAGAPDIPGAGAKTSVGVGTPTLANQLPSPQRGVADLTSVFEAYAMGLGRTP